MSSASARKELRELGQIVRQNGFKLAPSKGGHYQVLHGRGPKKGQKLIDEHGPVVLSSSPSDFRARDLAAARLIRSGALREDQLPWKPKKKQEHDGGGLLLGDDDEQDDGRETPAARKRLKQLTESRSRNERTQIIRGRLEPIITRLGGWTKRGLISEMGDVIYYHSKDSPFPFPSVAAAKANATSLRKGGTLSDDKATAWEALLDTLENAEPSPREAWFDLVRAARGLPSRVVPVVAYQPGTAVEQEGQHGFIMKPEVGGLARDMERQYGDGKSPELLDEHPLFAMHRDGGLRWPVEVTIDDLNELNRAVGFFEGLAVQLSFFDGQELVEPALEKIRSFVEKVGEARFKELADRGKVAGAA